MAAAMPWDTDSPTDMNVVFDRIDASLAHLDAGLPLPDSGSRS